MTTYVPPLWAVVSFKGWRLWVPLFLVWLLLLPFVLLLLPFALLAAVFLRGGFRMLGGLYGVFCALKGVEVDVDQPDARVRIVIR